MRTDPILIPIDAETRFRVTLNEFDSGSNRVSLTCEYRCMWCQPDADEDMREQAFRGGATTCRYCNGELWRSSPDEGTGLPGEKLDALIDALQSLRDHIRESV